MRSSGSVDPHPGDENLSQMISLTRGSIRGSVAGRSRYFRKVSSNIGGNSSRRHVKICSSQNWVSARHRLAENPSFKVFERSENRCEGEQTTRPVAAPGQSSTVLQSKPVSK